MNTHPPPFDLVIGLDRSDRKADLYLIDVRTGQRTKQTLDTSPEALHDWLAKLRQAHPQSQIAHVIGASIANPAVTLHGWVPLEPRDDFVFRPLGLVQQRV